MTKQPICASCHDEPAEEVQVVEIGRPCGYRLPNGPYKPNDINQDTADVCCVTAPVDAGGEVVRARSLAGIEFSDAVVSAADDVIVGNDDTGDGGEENGVRGQIGDKIVRSREEVPEGEREFRSLL